MKLNLYALVINGSEVCSVTMEAPSWLPVKPKLNQSWLRGFVQTALRGYFHKRER